jgi:hypothetical protein
MLHGKTPSIIEALPVQGALKTWAFEKIADTGLRKGCNQVSAGTR